MLYTLAHTLINYATVALEWCAQQLHSLDQQIAEDQLATHKDDVDEHADFANHEDPNIHR